MKRVWISILIVAIVIGGGGAYWYFSRDRTSENTVMISTTTVKRGTVATSVSGSGSLSPAVDSDVTVDADDAGKTISSINAAENEQVEKGDKLLTFTDGTTLTAPESGTVTSIGVYEDGRVNAGQKIAHITSYGHLNAVLQIDELDIPKIKKGQAVSLTVNAYPNKTFKGTVTSIAEEGSSENGTSTFDVTVRLASSSGLKSGMTATGEVVLEKKANVLYLPSGAVHQSGSSYYVYLSSGTAAETGRGMESKRGKQQTVTVGLHNDSSIEIKSGLEEGQTVQLNTITRTSGSAATNGQGQTQQMMPSMNGGSGGGGRFINNGGNGGGNGGSGSRGGGGGQ